MKFKVFISSVQIEFAKERRAIAKLIRTDRLLKHFFEPYVLCIALAMSWTSYVEKSGSGTGEIIDKCRDHGLATPVYDPTEGFFKTIIWRNGYGPMSKRDPVVGLSRGIQSEGPSRGPKSRGPSQRGSKVGRFKSE